MKFVELKVMYNLITTKVCVFKNVLDKRGGAKNLPADL